MTSESYSEEKANAVMRQEGSKRAMLAMAITEGLSAQGALSRALYKEKEQPWEDERPAFQAEHAARVQDRRQEQVWLLLFQDQNEVCCDLRKPEKGK